MSERYQYGRERDYRDYDSPPDRSPPRRPRQGERDYRDRHDYRRPPPPPSRYEDDYREREHWRGPPPHQPAYNDHQPARSSSYREDRQRQDVVPERPTKSKSPPSISVIFLGLPPDTTSDKLQQFLIDMGASLDSTTIIRDKMTGESKRFGFARFASVEHARSFVEPNFPTVVWKESGSMYEGLRVKIDYSQTDKVQRPDASSAYFEPERIQAEEEAVNDGSRDIGSAPSRYLFMRGLDSLVTESEVAAAFQNSIARRASAGAFKAGDGGLCRIFLVKDRSTSASWGFAFAEFAHVEAAVEGLKTVMSSKVNPQGFKIGSTTVGVTFSHPECFKPDYTSSRWSVQDLISGKDVLYWDNKAYLGILELPAAKALRDQQSGPAAQELDPDEEFFASLEQDLDAANAKESASAAPAKLPTAIPSVKLTSIALPSKTKASASQGSDQSVNLSDLPEMQSEPADRAESSKTGEKRKQREPELIAAKKNSVAIEHWNRKKLDEDEVALPAVEEPIDPFPHGDPLKFQCLLCARQFKELDTLKKHNEQSELHKTNLQKPEAVEKALTAKARLAPAYRDRAAERRIALNQPNKPKTEQPHFKRVKVDVPAPPPPPVQLNKEGIEESNIGRRMLEAAGWNKGEGLGSGGRADILEARQYQAGAGLGAAPSTAISELPADSSWNSSERGRDKARSRFQQP